MLEVSHDGAHVTRWAPEGFSAVLWCSPMRLPGKPLRGGIPLCWPWFGPHPIDPARPQHGYARLATWRDVAVGGGMRAFKLAATDCAAFNPEHQLTARLTIKHFATTLTLKLETTNIGSTTAPLSLALHTYFAVSDVAAITIDGLDGTDYCDNTRGGAVARQSGPMRITAETIALFDDAPTRQTILDPGLKRRIDIDRLGVGSTIVWNPGANAATMADIPPGEAKRFICVESGIIGRRAVTLAPNAHHVLDVTISVSAL